MRRFLPATRWLLSRLGTKATVFMRSVFRIGRPVSSRCRGVGDRFAGLMSLYEQVAASDLGMVDASLDDERSVGATLPTSCVWMKAHDHRLARSVMFSPPRAPAGSSLKGSFTSRAVTRIQTGQRKRFPPWE